MKTKMRPRYYCDHCGKGNGSPSYLRRHESGCTLNPNRVCKMCIEEQAPMADLIAVLDEHGFSAMCEAANIRVCQGTHHNRRAEVRLYCWRCSERRDDAVTD